MHAQPLSEPDAIESTGAFPIITALCSLVAVAFAALPNATQNFTFDTTTLTVNARWLSCHFVHWNLQHLLWSGAAFVVLGVLCERRCPRAYRWALAASMLLIPPVLYFAHEKTHLYGGLSGVDSALFLLYTLHFLRNQYRSGDYLLTVGAALMLLGFATKVAYEAIEGTALFANTPDTFLPVPLAHLAGGVVGLLAAKLDR